ncbi:DNA polymerase beta [Pleurotus pulmonarius]
MMDAFEIEQFFAEQDAIMNLPDGDIESRIATIIAPSQSEPGREDGLPKGILKSASDAVEQTPQHKLGLQSRPTNGQKRRVSDDIESRSKRPRISPAPQRQGNVHTPKGIADAPRLNIEPIPNYDAKTRAPQDTTCREDTFPTESPAPFDVTEDISVFTEPTVDFTKPQTPLPRIRNKRITKQEPQVKANGKNGTKKALQFVQLQGGAASSNLGAPTLSSSPIEEPTPLPSNAASKSRKVIPDSVSKGVERQMSAHASTSKRTKVVKLADRAKKDPEAGPSSPTDLSSSRNADTVELAGPTAGPSKGKKVPAKAPAKVAKSVTKTNDKNKKAPRCTPYEYAVSLQEKMLLRAEKPKEHKSQSLKGKVFFYIGSDMIYASQTTRGRMDYIVRHGGTLLPAYDPARLTHIVTDTAKSLTLRGLGVKSLQEVPKHIPIVTWSWVSAGLGRKRRANNQSRDESEVEIDDVFEHAAFNSEVSFYAETYGRGKQPTRVAKNIAVIDLNETGAECAENGSNRIASFTPTIPKGTKPRTLGSSSSSPHLSDLEASPEPGSSRSRKEDTFAKFYEQALAELEGESSACSGAEDYESDPGGDDEDFKPSHRPIKRGFACDRKEPQPIVSPNQDIVDKLQLLKGIHQGRSSQDDKWRVFSYGKSIRALLNHPTRIKLSKEARSISGVGEKTARKIMEILETGDLKRIEYESTEDVVVRCLFQGVYGVGQSTAQKWYANGCRTLEDLKNGKGGVKLSSAQEIGLKFYDDINARMPRDEAKALFDLIKPIALSIDPDLFVDIMGSYRRGKATCGDIDILITRNPADGKTHAGVLPTLLSKLHEIGIITEDLAIPEGDDEENVYRGLCKLPEPGSRRRRIDFLTVPWTSRGAALLYYTGDDIFNRAMRYKANVMGYSLNQRGLYSGVVRDPHDRRIKTNKGSLIASETEQEIFKILGVPWQEPHERVRG